MIIVELNTALQKISAELLQRSDADGGAMSRIIISDEMLRPIKTHEDNGMRSSVIAMQEKIAGLDF
jgi:hypothetical protein